MYTDDAIVEMFWDRNEDGIALLDKKYGTSLANISFHILNDELDAEECLNETYMRTWNSIPEARPNSLLAYTGKIIRNLSVDRIRNKASQKRLSDNFSVLLSEIAECLVSEENVESSIEYNDLAQDISIFLNKQTKEYRYYFVERYWYAMTLKEIANKHNDTEKKVESVLYRCRKKLKEYLIEREYYL